jgi:hypothetical protein
LTRGVDEVCRMRSSHLIPRLVKLFSDRAPDLRTLSNYRVWALGSRIWALGSRIWALGSRIWVPGSRIWALGSRIWALGSRVWALGSRVSF